MVEVVVLSLTVRRLGYRFAPQHSGSSGSSGTSGSALAAAVLGALSRESAGWQVEQVPDGEFRPLVGSVRGDDVYVLAPTGPPVNEHIVEQLLVLDACRRSGADRITAVVPHFGYARQDRRTRAGEPVGARVIAGALVGAGAAPTARSSLRPGAPGSRRHRR